MVQSLLYLEKSNVGFVEMINRFVIKLNGAGDHFQFDTEREKGLSENYGKSRRNFNYIS
jgi:hypothetical protein